MGFLEHRLFFRYYIEIWIEKTELCKFLKIQSIALGIGTGVNVLCLFRHGDQLEEDMARFYLAEMAVAINDLHQMGYLHR